MKKRIIKPHKGGRGEVVPIRARAEIKEMAHKIASKEGCSIADLFEKWVKMFGEK